MGNNLSEIKDVNIVKKLPTFVTGSLFVAILAVLIIPARILMGFSPLDFFNISLLLVALVICVAFFLLRRMNFNLAGYCNTIALVLLSMDSFTITLRGNADAMYRTTMILLALAVVNQVLSFSRGQIILYYVATVLCWIIAPFTFSV